MRGRLVRDFEKDREVKQRRNPQNERRRPARRRILPALPASRAPATVVSGLNRAELKFLGKQAHRDERKNQNKGEPEED